MTQETCTCGCSTPVTNDEACAGECGCSGDEKPAGTEASTVTTV